MAIRIFKHNRDNKEDKSCLLLDVDTTGVDDKYGIVYSKEKGKFIVEPVRTGITSGEHDEITQNIYNTYYNFTAQKALENVEASKDNPQIINIEVPETTDYNFGKLELLKYIDGTEQRAQLSLSTNDKDSYESDCIELIDTSNGIKLNKIFQYNIPREDISYNSKTFDYKYYNEIYDLKLLDNDRIVDPKQSGYLFLIQDKDGEVYTYKNRTLIKLNTIKLTDRLFLENGFDILSKDLYTEHEKSLYFQMNKIENNKNVLYKTPIPIEDIISIQGVLATNKNAETFITPVDENTDTSIITVLYTDEKFDTLSLNGTFNPILKDKKLLVYHKDNDKQLQLQMDVYPKPQTVYNAKDIQLDFIEELLKINFDVTNESNIKFLFSIDSGNSWFSCIDGILKNVKLINIKEQGMSAQDFNSIEPATWKGILNDNKTMRFAYHLDIKNPKDIASIRKIYITYKSKGEYGSLVQGQEYDYSYINTHTLSIKLYSDGKYKINYYNNNNTLKDNKVLLQWEEFDL